MYGELAAAISPCFVSACNPDLIARVFTNYFNRSKTMMIDQTKNLLLGWINIFESAANALEAVQDAAESLATHLLALPDEIKEIEDRICQNDACLGPIISSFMKKGNSQVPTEKRH